MEESGEGKDFKASLQFKEYLKQNKTHEQEENESELIKIQKQSLPVYSVREELLQVSKVTNFIFYQLLIHF